MGLDGDDAEGFDIQILNMKMMNPTALAKSFCTGGFTIHHIRFVNRGQLAMKTCEIVVRFKSK